MVQKVPVLRAVKPAQPAATVWVSSPAWASLHPLFSTARWLQGTSDQIMNSYLAPKMSSFIVAKLRNSQLLRALDASNLNILHHNLLRSELIRGSSAR